MVELIVVPKTNELLAGFMSRHYSKPNGFVGRSICYLIYYNNVCYGAIVSGSATKNLSNRNQFFNIKDNQIGHIINNTFFRLEKQGEKYPIRNFSCTILESWRKQATQDWHNKYGDVAYGFETLVSKNYTGEVYRRDGWLLIGETIGFTCKRVAGKSTDKWGGRRMWNTDNLDPKFIFARYVY